MIDPVIQDASAGRLQLMPLTLDQYHRMIDTELLPHDLAVEFIDGFIVRKDRSKRGEDPMTVGRAYAWVITQLTKLVADVASRGAQLRIQLPISVPPDLEPEPDAVIVRADVDDYAAGHPRIADVYCVIEVADSSLESDRVTKQRIYADEGISFYAIVNLPESCIEMRSEPRVGEGVYAVVQRIERSGAVRFSCGQSDTGSDTVLEIGAERLLPRFR